MPKRKLTDGDPLTSTDPVEIEALIGRLKHSDLPERDALLVERLLRLVLTLVSMLEHKNASISRLKRLLFGPRSDKRGQSEAPAPPSAGDATTPSCGVASAVRIDRALGTCTIPTRRRS
jgi:hypothetical protein